MLGVNQTREYKAVVCQSCGQEIQFKENVVRVSYGTLYWTAHPHANVHRKKQDDYFHKSCDVAIRSEVGEAEDVGS